MSSGLSRGHTDSLFSIPFRQIQPHVNSAHVPLRVVGEHVVARAVHRILQEYALGGCYGFILGLVSAHFWRIFLIYTLQTDFHTADAIALLRVFLRLRLELIDHTNMRVQFDQRYLGLQQNIHHDHEHLVGIKHQLVRSHLWHVTEHLFIIDRKLFARFDFIAFLKLPEALVSILMLDGLRLLGL